MLIFKKHYCIPADCPWSCDIKQCFPKWCLRTPGAPGIFLFIYTVLEIPIHYYYYYSLFHCECAGVYTVQTLHTLYEILYSCKLLASIETPRVISMQALTRNGHRSTLFFPQLDPLFPLFPWSIHSLGCIVTPWKWNYVNTVYTK